MKNFLEDSVIISSREELSHTEFSSQSSSDWLWNCFIIKLCLTFKLSIHMHCTIVHCYKDQYNITTKYSIMQVKLITITMKCTHYKLVEVQKLWAVFRFSVINNYQQISRHKNKILLKRSVVCVLQYISYKNKIRQFTA